MSPKFRKILLGAIFLFIFIHFLKDITQDILRIPTPLDFFGDIKEDLSSFPGYVQTTFLFLGAGSFIVEAFLLFAIPVVIKRKVVTRLERTVYIIVGLMVLYFISVTLFDPRLCLFNSQ